jgi:hypothetical protein
MLIIVIAAFCSGKKVSKSVISSASIKTHVFEKYVVFETLHADANATDIIVMDRKYGDNFSKIDTKKAVFVLNNQETGFFSNLFQKYLFMDYGTGPDQRMLSVFDITNGKKVLDTAYSDDIALIGKDTVSIWLESSDTTFSKCKDHEKWKDGGLGTAIIVEHYFNIRTLKFYKTPNWKCVSRQ